MDIGLAIPEDIKTRAADSDVPTNCDQHFSPTTVTNPATDDVIQLPLPLSDPRCARGQDTWKHSFNLQNGMLAGISFGYAWRGLRVEAEYFHRGHHGESSQFAIQSGGKEDEFVVIGEKISDIRAHHFFANFYYDFSQCMEQGDPLRGRGRRPDAREDGLFGAIPEKCGPGRYRRTGATPRCRGHAYVLTERFSVGVKGTLRGGFLERNSKTATHGTG